MGSGQKTKNGGTSVQGKSPGAVEAKRAEEMVVPGGQRPTMVSGISSIWTEAVPLYTAAALLRIILLLYGLYQDAHAPVKYTDIDYLVFTDAARFVHRGASPYARETYRYTPLLAWMLLPTAWETSSSFWNAVFFSSGKVLFAVADLVAGWLIEHLLATDMEGQGGGSGQGGDAPPRNAGKDRRIARTYAAIWLLNPMVAAISTRGSSEGLLAVLVMALLWATLARRVMLAGFLLGLGVHFKIYPFIYAPAIIWWMSPQRMQAGRSAVSKKAAGEARQEPVTLLAKITGFITADRITLTVVSLATFLGLNILMYTIYGFPFLQHTYLHHVTRIDHRHNFSPYNTLLYLTSASPPESSDTWLSLQTESLAFLPQLLLSCVLIPLFLAKHSLAGTMLAQTFAFVAFNKVCTSQYFLWYLVLLPLHLPYSAFLGRRRGTEGGRLGGVAALGLWIAGQTAWLAQAFELEFLGRSTFVPGLWAASLGFFAVNCWILGVFVQDVAAL